MDSKLIAYHLDLKHGLWSRLYLERLVTRLAAWGYNTLVLEIEDKLQFAAAPSVSSPDAMTHKQMAGFTAFCRKQGVEVIPLVQSLGHAEYVVGKEVYAHLRESSHIPTQYDPLSDEASQLIMDLFDETIAVTQPTTWFHIGGDEAWSLGSSEKAKAIVAKEGVGGLYLQHILPLCEHIRRRGLRPMIWADMFLSYPELLEHVPDYAMLVDWDYWTDSSHPQSIMIWGGYQKEHRNAAANQKQYSQALRKTEFKTHLAPYARDEQGQFKPFYCTDALLGHGVKEVLVAPANSCHGDLAGIPNNQLHIPNCWHAARKGLQDGCGVLVTSWSVRHVHSEVRQLGTFAAAQAARDTTYDFNAICLAYSQWMYGEELPDFSQAVRLAGESFEMGQSFCLVKARDALLRGEDAYLTVLEGQIVQAGGRQNFIQKHTALRDGYLRAQALFQQMANQATRNEDHFACWIEGIELSILHVDFALALCQSTLQKQADTFAQRIAQLRENSERIFAPSFTSEGLAEEMQVRYGYHELYLEKLGAATNLLA